MDSHVFVFNKNFSVPFSSHDFFQSVLETMKAPNIYKFKGQGVLHVWLKKYHLLIHEPAAWLVDVIVLVLEETVNNNFLFTFSMSFMVLHISFHSSFSRLKSPGLFICSSYGKYFIPLITLVLKNFPSLLHSSWRWGEREKESILSWAQSLEWRCIFQQEWFAPYSFPNTA